MSSAAETVNWSPTGALSDAGTSATPAMTTCNGVTYMAWKGVGDDEHMYYTTADVETNVDQPNFPLSWATQRQVDTGSLTDLSPSLAVLPGGNGTPYLAWKGAGGDTSVHWATMPGIGDQWQQLGTVPGVSTVRSPTLTVGLSTPFTTPRLSVIWPLIGGQQVYRTDYVGGSWSGPAPLVGGSGAAPAATNGPADGYSPLNNLVAWQGSGSDTHIWYTVLQNQSPSWQPQQLVTNGGPTTTGLAAADNVQCPTEAVR